MSPMTEFTQAPCANSDDPDAWFINYKGRLDPEERQEIIAARPNAPKIAKDIIDRLERENRVRLRAAIRTCWFDCPRALRLRCLAEGLEEPAGVRGSYTEYERRQIVKIRDDHKLTGARVAEVVLGKDRREAFKREGGDRND